MKCGYRKLGKVLPIHHPKGEASPGNVLDREGLGKTVILVLARGNVEPGQLPFFLRHKLPPVFPESRMKSKYLGFAKAP
jgi:hypothetical protein